MGRVQLGHSGQLAPTGSAAVPENFEARGSPSRLSTWGIQHGRRIGSSRGSSRTEAEALAGAAGAADRLKSVLRSLIIDL
jgi:hypothetical protein